MKQKYNCGDALRRKANRQIPLEITNQWADTATIVQKGFTALPTDQLRHRWQDNEARKSKQGGNYDRQ
jgi:hypothetical protein